MNHPVEVSDLKYVLASGRTNRARKGFKPAEIIAKSRQFNVPVSQGQSMAHAIRQIGVSTVTFCRGRQEIGALKTEQVEKKKAVRS